MKVADRCALSIQFIIKNSGENGEHIEASKLAYRMREGGWKSVTTDNIVATARSIGFTVIGETIYDLDM